MSLKNLLEYLELDGLPLFKDNHNDDVIDRLSRRTTVLLLVLASVVLTTTQLVGDPISCWTPAHFKKDSHDTYEEYINSYCWIRNTYYLPYEESIPDERKVLQDGGKHMHVTYYQWVPAILLVQALFFHAPHLVWNALSTRSTLNFGSLIKEGRQFAQMEMTDVRDEKLRNMTSQMVSYLRFNKAENSTSDHECVLSTKHLLTRTCSSKCGRRHGNCLVIRYAFVKLLYLANAVGQIFLLDLFFGDSAFHAYGIDVIRGAVGVQSDSPETTSVRFPRVTMCDFKVRRLGNVHRYAVQCVLTINAFNEKIFTFFWFWFVLVAVLTTVSIVAWFRGFALSSVRRRYVRQHLGCLKELEVKQFEQYLGQDGVLILRLFTYNTSVDVATEFVTSLWNSHPAVSAL